MELKDLPPVNDDPIAIVGIGCRFPGAVDTPENLWNLLCEGKNAITEVPPDRWDISSFYDSNKDKNGKIYTRKGGFISNISHFDPQFFGISPREAAFMDPQQRLLLEVTWEALEDGGLAPEKLMGSPVGVYIGLFMHDYENIHGGVTERGLFGPHSATGLSATISANRISYAFDFTGPSLVVDTACSSSLVAVHLACQSLRNNESEIAIAGGANILLRPEMTMVLCKGSFLSPDGYCKAFDARADGYVRSEGVGVVVLKRLLKAIADNDPIYACILGSAVNQDGKSPGLTVPSAVSQIRAIREALHVSGKKPEDIKYVEAHGTGTSVGDPIEAKALGTVLSKNRPADQPCLVGSVKSNFGHTESAAGIAGLIKTALILKHGKIPANLHFETPNPNIPFEELRLRVPVALEQWPSMNGEKTRVAGVNSFGFGGTNSHVVLENYDSGAEAHNDVKPGDISTAESNSISLLPFSARSTEALKDVARELDNFITSTKNVRLEDIGYTTSLRHGHHDHRLTVAVRTIDELQDHLRAFRDGGKLPGMSIGQTGQTAPSKIVFVFSGMGQQWTGMGKHLMETEPVFRDSIDACDALFLKLTDDWSIREVLYAKKGNSRLHETQVAQPCIFSIQVALAALWKEWGIVPDAIVGHSVGEIAAVYTSGVLCLENAVNLTYHRSRLQHRLAGKGAMLAIGLPLDETERLLNGAGGKVSVAAINSPYSLTLSGDKHTLEEIDSRLKEANVFSRFLKVDVPFHSPGMDEILPEFKESIKNIKPQPGHTTLVSTVTGKRIDWQEITTDYWCRNVRQPVLFADAFKELNQSDNSVFIEISAQPVLAPSMVDCMSGLKRKCTMIPSLRRRGSDDVLMYEALGKLYTTGYPVDWTKLYKKDGQFIRLPSYPWQREIYWTETEASQSARQGHSVYTGSSLIGRNIHPLLGGRLNTATPSWNAEIDLNTLDYLKDHVVQGSVVFPGAGYVELALAAAGELYGDAPYCVHNISIEAPLILSEDTPATVQIVVKKDNAFSIHGKSGDYDQEWSLHAEGKLEIEDENKTPPVVSLIEISERCSGEIAGDALYRNYQSQKLEYGPFFKPIEHVWHNEDESIGRLTFADAEGFEPDNYRLHPIVLDACFQVLGAINTHGAYLPVFIESVTVYKRPDSKMWCHALVTKRSDDLMAGDILLFDDEGNVCAGVRGLHCRLIRGSQEPIRDSIENIRYEYDWKLEHSQSASESMSDITYFPDSITISKRISPLIEEYAERYERQHYYEIVEPKLNELCVHYIVKTLEDMAGGLFEVSTSFETDELAERVGVIGQHKKLFGRLLNILEEDGILKRDGQRWEVLRNPESVDPRQAWQKCIEAHPSYGAELILTEKCGSRLKGVLRGEQDPLSIIFAKGSSVAEHLYHNSPTLRIYNKSVQLAIGAILEQLPEGQTLRICEIGAGTGSLTSHVLPLLPINRTQYVYTDISAAFTGDAKQKFRKYDFIEYKTLNIEKDPVPQGFDSHSFDIILASDVIHVASEIKRSLNNVKSLLAPHGMIMIIEATAPPRWFDIVFGLLEGWWMFSDYDLRPDHVLLTRPKWISLLDSLGFEDVIGFPENEGGHDTLHSVLIARRGGLSESEMSSATTVSAESEDADNSEVERDGKWIIFADDQGFAARISEELSKEKLSPVIVTNGTAFEVTDSRHLIINPAQPKDFRKLFDMVCSDSSIAPTIINLHGIVAPTEEISAKIIEEMTSGQCAFTLYLVQALMSRDWQSSPDLWIVTKGTQMDKDISHQSLVSSLIWGLGRVMGNEFENCSTRMVDIGSVTDNRERALFCRELLNPVDEDEIAIRGNNRYIRRFIHKRDAGFPRVPTTPYMLTTTKPGGFDNVSFMETETSKAAAGQVTIKVNTAGLNFKDVAKVSGMLDKNVLNPEGIPDHLGMECSGVIVDIGEGAVGFAIGDEVMGFALNCFSNYITTDYRAVVHKPSYLSFEEASTIPLVFLASHYALHTLAHIKKGERVLIHTASGGVGLSAIQIARAAGAEIFATAGTPEKRDYVRAMGIKYVGDSRSLSFVDEILALTGNEGVDIVLNMLPVQTIAKSMSLLKPLSGRFVDIVNVYEPNLALNRLDRGVTFHAFTLENVIWKYPEIAGTLLREIMESFDKRFYHALPHRTFSVSELGSAMKNMRKGVHIGKIIVSMQDPGVRPVHTNDTIPVNPDGTYIISGGCSGFGLAVAKWLITCGARHLTLLSRRGAATPNISESVIEMEKAGAKVLVVAVDVTREDQVRDIVDEICRSMPPIRGVIHAAMVLEDISLMKMSAKEVKNVLDPKALGAWNLHTQTLDKPLDFFISFSSLASLLGNSDQGNYAAGNAFLDTFSHYRNALGLPALTVNWGAIGDVGYVAQHEEIQEYFKRQGVDNISLKQVWRTLSHGLEKNSVQTASIICNWNTLSKFNHSIAHSPKFSDLLRTTAGKEKSSSGKSVNLPSASSGERKQVLAKLLAEEVAFILGIPFAEIDTDVPIDSKGFDSLMAIELMAGIDKISGLSIPKMILLKPGLTVAALTDILEQELVKNGAEPSVTVDFEETHVTAKRAENQDDAQESDTLPVNVEELSDDEVDAMLQSMLSGKDDDE